MTRLEGWEGRLEKYIKDSVDLKFEWGVIDCVLWSVGWFEILTGIDLLTDVRGKYSTKDEADALIEKFGGLGAAFTAKIPKRVPGFEKRGDLALCNIDGMDTIGIVAASGFIFFLIEKGICAKKIKPVSAWGVD
jgi:hypothetical protein